MNKKYIRLVKKDVRNSVKSGVYAIVENSKLQSNNERMANVIRYLLSIGAPYVNVRYLAGFDGLKTDYSKSCDLITMETSDKKLQEILKYSSEDDCSIWTHIVVNGENIGVSFNDRAEFRCHGRYYPSAHKEAKVYNDSDMVWNLEDYFNSFEAA